MKRILTYVALAAIMIVPRAASASSILYFSDLDVGVNQMQAALASPALAGHTVTTAVSAADFTTLLTSNPFDLAILFEQSLADSDFDDAFSALSTFISGGRWRSDRRRLYG